MLLLIQFVALLGLSVIMIFSHEIYGDYIAKTNPYRGSNITVIIYHSYFERKEFIRNTQMNTWIGLHLHSLKEETVALLVVK